MIKCFKFEGAIVRIDGHDCFCGWTKECIFKWREKFVVTEPKDKLQHGYVVLKGVCGYVHAASENKAVQRIQDLC